MGSESKAWAARAAELDRLKCQGLWLSGPAAALEVLGQTGVERAHQAYIAWLLDPGGSHGLGTGVLVNLLRHFSPEATIPPQLTLSRVKKEDARAQSRADIVVSSPTCTVVIELKVHSGEGDEQTRRLAEDHSGSPSPLFIFLTLNGDQPRDTRFQSMLLRELAVCVRTALDEAPQPRSHNEERGRATARDYLSALERKCGMEPVNQHAAVFWARHGFEMLNARDEAIRLLTMLPEAVEKALGGLAQDLGGDLEVSRFPYVAQGRYNRTYQEVAVLLHRRRWRGSGTEPKFGIGFGQRASSVDFFDTDKKPWFGVWAADPNNRNALGDSSWHLWAKWDYVDLTPPENGEDLLSWYGDAVVRAVRQTWEEDGPAIDGLDGAG